MVGALETMLELLFDTGRVSNRAVLQAISARTPRGRELQANARDVTRALRTLRNQIIADMRFSTRGSTDHSLIIETDRVRVTLDFSRAGATITNLEVG